MTQFNSQGLTLNPPVVSLYYFPLLARGFGPTLCLEFAEIPYTGNVNSEPINYKEISPFGQMPVMTFKDGKTPAVSQTIAIINIIGKLAKSDGCPSQHGQSISLFAYSNQLMFEAEDIYQLMVKYLPTASKPLSHPSKGTVEDYDNFLSVLFPEHMSMIERMISSHFELRSQAWDNNAFTTGELFLFSMLYQMTLVEPSCLNSAPTTKSFFNQILNHPKTKTVLEGKSSMGELNQYFFKHG